MSLAAIIILASAALFWVLVSLYSGGNNVSKEVDTRPSGIGSGWICVIVLLLMVAIIMFSNKNADQHNINEPTDGIWWILLIIFFLLFMLYLKGVF